MSDGLPEGWDDLARADAEALGPPDGAKDRVRRRIEGTLGVALLAGVATGVATTVTVATTASASVVATVKVVVGLAALSAVTGTAYVELRHRAERAHHASPPSAVQLNRPTARIAPIEPTLASDPLAEEEELLTSARSALSRGALDEASRRLELHRNRFGEGRLSEERDALEIRLLVRAGREAEARRRASEFRAVHPTSIQLQVIDQALRGEP